MTVIGKLPVSDPKVTLLDDGTTASLGYCTNESEAYTKHRKTGKVEGNPKDMDPEVYYLVTLKKSSQVWQNVAPRLAALDDTSLCNTLMFWQDAGEIPDVPNAPTPPTLAEYAYDKVEVPATEIEAKPAAKSTVNLPTWVWLDKGTFKEVKVRAELPHTGLWAETTAKPVALHLEPGTADAETFPASGDCEINADGSIGTPYTKGRADQTPPCGIRYLRASSGAPYQLKASITWEISWEGTGGAQGDLPDGTFETTQDMEVQEIQSINR